MIPASFECHRPDSDDLAARCPILREAALRIADPQVRACGTIGGNVANGDPGNDLPAVMMALDASVVLRGPGGERSLTVRGFYQGPFETARDDDEIVEVRRKAAAVGLAEIAGVTDAEDLEGGAVETRIVPPTASGCCGDGKH